MRAVAALVLLLLTIHANAGETTFGPFVTGPRDPSFAVAFGSEGMLAAWSQLDPASNVALIHTALFDLDGNRIGPIHKLPTVGLGVPATSPAITTDGTSFFVAWIERDPYRYSGRSDAGVFTDGTGQPIEKPRRLGAASTVTPAVIWDGVEFRFHEKSQRVPFATPWVNGWVDWASYQPPIHCGMTCYGPPERPLYILHWSVISHDWIRSGKFQARGYLAAGPAVTAQEDDLLLVWSSPSGLEALRIVDGFAGTTFSLPNPIAADVTPAMAGSLVVFEKKNDIYGSIVDGDRFIQPFVITDTEEHEGSPRVYQIGERRYLVTYTRAAGHGTISMVFNILDL